MIYMLVDLVDHHVKNILGERVVLVFNFIHKNGAEADRVSALVLRLFSLNNI